jgi:hypothetical protein
VFSAPQRRRCLTLSPPWLRFLGTIKYAKGRWQKWARVASHRAGAARGQAVPPWREGPSWLLSTPPSGFLSLLGKYNFLVFFWNFPDLQNMVPWWSFF